MAITIFQIFYYLVFFTMALMSAFIVFHIVAYSYSAKSKTLMLTIFLPVVMVLLVTNFILFVNLPLEKLFSSILPY